MTYYTIIVQEPNGERVSWMADLSDSIARSFPEAGVGIGTAQLLLEFYTLIVARLNQYSDDARVFVVV